MRTERDEQPLQDERKDDSETQQHPWDPFFSPRPKFDTQMNPPPYRQS